jgi:hypothetical protein
MMLTQTSWSKRLWLVTAVVMMSLALFVQPAYAQEPDWTWQNPLPQGNPLWGVWGSSGSDVFAVGDWGTVLHYDGIVREIARYRRRDNVAGLRQLVQAKLAIDELLVALI